MIFRLTQKLGRKIGMNPSEKSPRDANPYADWTANLFSVRRVQYIIVSNTTSLYSTLLYGRGITDIHGFLTVTLGHIKNQMEEDGHGFLYQRVFVPAMHHVQFSKTDDRRVLGSINELVFIAQVFLESEDLAPHDVSPRMNQVPLSCLGGQRPKDVFGSMHLPTSSEDAL